jgi:hypothetical protein
MCKRVFYEMLACSCVLLNPGAFFQVTTNLCRLANCMDAEQFIVLIIDMASALQQTEITLLLDGSGCEQPRDLDYDKHKKISA